MTGAPNRYEAMMARLSAEPGLNAIGKPGGGVLVWDRAVERLLWASPAMAGLREAVADGAGRVSAAFRALERLRVLAVDLAGSDRVVRERLRLDPARPWLPVSCLCRMVTLDDGEVVLVTVLAGPLPRISGYHAPAAEVAAAPDEQDMSGTPPEPPAPQEERRVANRFVWQADAQARFTYVSPSLGEAVGPVSADIVGRSWDEVSRTMAEDPHGEVSALFARRETGSGRTIFWNIDNSSLQVPVEWAGMPVFGEGRELTGFRGFGRLRMDALRQRMEASPEEEQAAPADDESWFAQLRDRVAEALSAPHPSEAEGEPEPEGGKPRPAVSAGALSHTERNAFHEIARALSARFGETPSAEREPDQEILPPDEEMSAEDEAPPRAPAGSEGILDRLPIGILVHRGEEVLFANRFLLDLAGYEDSGQIKAEGGLMRLFRDSPVLAGTGEEGPPLALTTRREEAVPVEIRSSSAEWEGDPAQLMVIRRLSEAAIARRRREERIHELEAILDTATDGVLLLDETGHILSLNRSAEALFGYDQREVLGSAVTALLAPESHQVALDYLEGLRSSGVASLLNDGREVLGRVRQGGAIPLFMTLGCVNEGPERRFCAVLRDISSFKKAEGELVGAKRAAEEASAQKSDLLAKISHEIRTPLNAIIGFAEVMLEERFGPVGNDRYKDYLKDIHASGSHVISLVNDLLDLAKIEAGRLELSFTGVRLNDQVAACVALLQPQAARARIVMRTSFAEKLPPVVADERSVRQIVLNLVSNAIKFTDAGGQVIVSTALTDRGEVAFRVRDTGIGMTEQEVETALEPFRQLATARRRGGTGLGLPLTKALVEANKGALQIASHPNEGTLVEVIFPPTRVLAG